MIRPTAVHLHLPGDRPPWTSTGLAVRRGDRVTLLGSGRIAWSGGLGAGPKYHLWGRVRGGRIFGCTQDTTTVVVDRSGELELCVYLGTWADPSGTLADGSGAYRPGRGRLDVTVLHWPAGTDPVDGLCGVGPDVADPALAAAERRRLLDPVVPPAGWEYLLAVGPGDIFRHCPTTGAPAIEVVSDDDAGVLEKPVDVAVGPNTVLDWDWRVESLPCRGPAATHAAHDHLGIAARFADGQHLSWFWSPGPRQEADAPDSPVPGWRGRRCHVPVRRGPAGLGRWRPESRLLLADHHRFVGRAPARIAAIQLIAVSHVGHGSGRAAFRHIRLRDGHQQVRLL